MMSNSVKQAFNDAVEAVATSEPLFELEQREIRGVEFMTFRNGPKTLRDVSVSYTHLTLPTICSV